MYPVFFSVSGKDVSFAERVWEAFPDDWVYLYTKTGRQGVHFWDEIAADELPKAKVFVVFWSQSYSESEGCLRELAQASSLFARGMLKPIILRLDDFPLAWHDALDLTLKPVFEALQPLANFRASATNASIQQAQSLISTASEPLLQSDHPRVSRNALAEALRKSLRQDRFTLKPGCWVSGFNGVGRESLVRDINRNLTPNGTGIVIEVNEATLPQQLLLRIESEAFGANRDQLRAVLGQRHESDVEAVAAAIERLYQAGNYLILRHGRIVQEEVELPDWLDDVALALRTETRPKMFIISQQPLFGPRLIKCTDKMAAFRVPTLNEVELTEASERLIGHFDSNPSRWKDEDVERIAQAAGGTIGFLVSIIRSASRFEDFADIEAMLAQQGSRMAESITVYARWAFAQLRDEPDAQKTLLFLNDVTPCHILDLEAAISPKSSMIRVLSRLINLGLVEREDEDIYRLTPLLANRLNHELIRPELLQWVSAAKRKFASHPFDVADEVGHEYIRLEARIGAVLGSGDALPEQLSAFVSAAHWFQAGIRLYHARRWQPAYRLLKHAQANRNAFRDASRFVLDRYFCLAATRMRQYGEAEACINRLNNDHRSRPIAAFLQADLHEYRREFVEAIRFYKSALSLNSNNDRRLEFIYRPLIRCILETSRPDFAEAERYAKSYLNHRQTVFSLSALARVYLEWKYRGSNAGREIPADIDRLYADALEHLEQTSGANASPFELYALEAEFTGDYVTAIENMDEAIRLDPNRFQLKAERWRMMVGFGDFNAASTVVRELDQARADVQNEAIWPSYIRALTDTYVRALKLSQQPYALANGFAPELQVSSELALIVARVRRS